MSVLVGSDARNNWRWPHFSTGEFTSHGEDGPYLLVDTEYMDRLERLRIAFGHPMPVMSGYRTPAHNQAVSTTGPKGPHTTGRAADVTIRGPEAFELVRLAILHGFTGIGVKQHGPSRFLHLDDLPDGAHPRPRVWSY